MHVRIVSQLLPYALCQGVIGTALVGLIQRGLSVVLKAATLAQKRR